MFLSRSAPSTVSLLSGGRIWKPVVAGLCGTLAHFVLMYIKSRAGLLSSFHPYQNLQATLSHLIGTEVNPVVPWLLSFVNGSVIMGFVFGQLYRQLPGKTGAIKGMTARVLGWTIMGLLFFPMIGLGFFGFQAGLGMSPALFSLAMLLTYSVVMGVVYEALSSRSPDLPTS
jgi:hypothetical protein